MRRLLQVCFGLLILAVLVARGEGSQETQVAGTPSPSRVRPAAQPVPGRYIVVLKNGEELARIVDVDAEADSVALRYNAAIGARWKHALLGFVADMSRDQAEALAADPRVALVEQDGVGFVNTTQNVPVGAWGLDRIDQRDLPLDDAYNYYTYGGATVYVIDSGIRATHHEFLNAQGTASRVSGGYTFINDGRGTDDCMGHGTHVAGIIGGRTYGVAKEVSLVPVRVFDCLGGGTVSSYIGAADWVTANHAQRAVANMSLGVPTSAALDTAVQNSVDSGVSYVVAAGNSDLDACGISPARVPTATTVAATDSADSRVIGSHGVTSNWGTCVDIFAPGNEIASAHISNDSSHLERTGTSQAAPHVAGAAALYYATDNNALPTKVALALMTSATANRVANAGTGSPNFLLHSRGFGP